jgi:uncharacterized repeat protein (TIGR02543 family)
VSTARRLVLLCVALFAVTASPALAAGDVQVSVSGAGTVAAPGIHCSRAFGAGLAGDCAERYANVRECIDSPFKPICLMVPPFVTFTAANTASGFVFDGWTGECAGQGPACTLQIAGDHRMSAIFKDVQDPSVSLSGVGAVTRGPVTLKATAADNAGVARVDFTLAGATISDASAPYSATFNSAGLKDGSTQAVATAVDVNGRAKAMSTGTVIDNTAPAATVSGPNGAVFGPGGAPAWTIAPADAASGVQSVTCSLVAAGAAADFKPCGASFTAPVRGHGTYVFTTRVTDHAGNSADVVRTYAIDAVAPVTTIGAGVAEGAVVSDTTLSWEFGADEAGARFACRVYPAALTPGAFAPCSAAGAHTAAGFAPGVYTFEVQATDAVGNVEASSARRTFTVVPAPPAAAAAAAPAAQPPVPGLSAAGKSGATAPQLRVNVTFTFSNSTRKHTKLTSLLVHGVPAGSTVSAKGFKKTNAKGRVSLKKLLKKPFKAGSTIKITISNPAMGTTIKTVKILPRKTPKVTTRCQAPGAAKPKPC